MALGWLQMTLVGISAQSHRRICTLTQTGVDGRHADGNRLRIPYRVAVILPEFCCVRSVACVSSSIAPEVCTSCPVVWDDASVSNTPHTLLFKPAKQ